MLNAPHHHHHQYLTLCSWLFFDKCKCLTFIYLQIVDYLEKEWSCKHEIQLNAPEFAVWTFDSHDSVQKVSLDLGMNTLSKRGSIVMSLYCPFWMLNKTGVMLTYRVSWRTYVLLKFSRDFFSDFQVITICWLQQLMCI